MCAHTHTHPNLKIWKKEWKKENMRLPYTESYHWSIKISIVSSGYLLLSMVLNKGLWYHPFGGTFNWRVWGLDQKSSTWKLEALPLSHSPSQFPPLEPLILTMGTQFQFVKPSRTWRHKSQLPYSRSPSQNCGCMHNLPFTDQRRSMIFVTSVLALR